MEHISEVMRRFLLQELEKVRQAYENKQIDKSTFEKLVNEFLDKINQIDEAKKK